MLLSLTLVLGLELSLRTHLKSLALALKVESLTLALKVGSLALALKVESLLALILNIFINFYLTALQCSLKNVL